jgi:group II intron reverse transcriptase/maturase
MQTGLKRIAEKSRKEANLKFTSLAHHVTEQLVWDSLRHIPKSSAKGTDEQTVNEAKETFHHWIGDMLTSVHRCSYRAPVIRRVHIPKPGKPEKRPIGIPTIKDRALQRSVYKVLSSIYEKDFLKCSFGGRPKIGAHHALCTFSEVVGGKKVSWVLEADLKNFFGSLDHGWLLRFVEYRVGDPRILKLISSWLKAGVLEDGKINESLRGTPQGGSISVILSNIYLHYVLDLWFEKAVKPRLNGEAYLVRYLDDFIVCFQHRKDALTFQRVLVKRLAKFSLQIQPSKTKLVEFGRFAQRDAKKYKRKLQTVYFLGFTHFCKRNKRGNFMIGRKTEKSRLRRSIASLTETMRIIRHYSLKEQITEINQILRGHYAYYGMGGNIDSLKRIYRFVISYWHKMLSSRSQKGYVPWEKFEIIKTTFPIQTPRLRIPYSQMKSYSVL